MKPSFFFSKNKKGIKCLNCGQTISENDNFCPNCGQVNDENRISLKQYFSEYLSGFYSFDNRFIKTVMPLIFKPGKVTREYIEGKRKKYVNPFQFYLHVTIIFFLIQGVFNTIDEYKFSNTSNRVEAKEGKDLSNLLTNDNTLKKPILNNINKKDSLNDSKTHLFDSYIDSIFTNSDYLEKLSSTELSKAEKDSIFDFVFNSITEHTSKSIEGLYTDDWDGHKKIIDHKSDVLDHIKSVFKEKQVNYDIPEYYSKLVEDSLFNLFFEYKRFSKMKAFIDYDRKNKEANVNIALDEMGYEKSYWNIFYFNNAKKINKSQKDPVFWKSWADSFISKISIALFFLLPIFTLIVALLYIRSKYNYTEHLVFVFHVQTAFFIILILTIIIDRIFNTSLISFFLIIFLFYLYKAMRNFYKQGRFKTLVKHFILNTFFMVMALIGGIIISFLAFLI
ncbi:MAG: DUF3667 domain-containing protein [Bacteroidota bacterium]